MNDYDIIVTPEKIILRHHWRWGDQDIEVADAREGAFADMRARTQDAVWEHTKRKKGC